QASLSFVSSATRLGRPDDRLARLRRCAARPGATDHRARPGMVSRRRAGELSVLALTALALLSAWHSGRHTWRVRVRGQRTYGAYSDAERRRAPLATLELPGDVFDWYASLLAHGDRAYYQVLQSGFSHDLDLPAAFGYGARFYLLPALEETDLVRATVVVSYQADPRALPARYVTQRRSGLQPIFVSRIGAP